MKMTKHGNILCATIGLMLLVSADSRRAGAEGPLVPKIYDVGDLVNDRAHSVGNWLHGQPFDSAGSSVSGLQGFGGFTGGGGFGAGGGGGGMGGAAANGGGFFSVPSNILPQFGGGGGGLGGGGMGGMGMGGGGMPASTMNSVTLGDLIEVIQGAVENERWEDLGGDCRISIFGRLLVITCDEAMHAKTEQLLTLLREQHKPSPTMSIAVRILPLDAASLEKLDSVTPDAAAAMAEDEAAIRISVRCGNRRVAAIAAGERRSFIYGVTPVVGNEDAPASRPPGKSIGYSPRVITPMIGVIGKVHPVVLDTKQASGRNANIGLGLVWASTPEEVSSVTFGQGQTMDRLEIAVAELETRVAVPEDRWTVAGLMTTNGKSLEHVAVLIRWREVK